MQNKISMENVCNEHNKEAILPFIYAVVPHLRRGKRRQIKADS